MAQIPQTKDGKFVCTCSHEIIATGTSSGTSTGKHTNNLHTAAARFLSVFHNVPSIVSWYAFTSSALAAKLCICTIELYGHAHISDFHCQVLCHCAMLHI